MRTHAPGHRSLMRLVTRLAIVSVGLAVAPSGRAGEIYKCVDATGRPLYTSDKRDTVGKKCQLVTREITVVPAAQVLGKSPTSGASSSREETPARASGRDRQRQILEKELASEQEMLDKARKSLVEQEAQRSGNERNYARVEERLKPFRDDVLVHEKNIEALRRELSNLNR